MLKTNHTNLKRYKIPLISSVLGLGGIFLFSYLTFVPNQTFAKSLIVDPNEKRSLSDISTMQEMSQQICINSREEETKQLRDTRDNKTYWVTKLKDGNCWMTQNLDYDGGGTKATSISDWPSSGNTYQGYYDPGNYYYAGPSGNHSQDTTNSCNGVTSITDSECSLYNSINPSDTSAATQELMHYHVGNYYSWNAATNGTGDTITSGEAFGSICPDDWKLPTSNSIDKGSFAYLLQKYNMASSATSGTIQSTASVGDKIYWIYSDPLYFVYGAYLHNGRLSHAAFSGTYWSSTPRGSNEAYVLYFVSQVSPSGSNDRYAGFSVRCLAEGGGFPPELSDTATSNVSITVSPVISIDVTKHANDMEVDFTHVATSSIVAKIGSNQGYQVLLSTNQSNLEQSPIIENQHIPMVPTDQKIVAGTKGWGISKDITIVSSTGTTITNPTINTNTIYSPIGIGDNKTLFYTSTKPASEDLTFPVAIAVDSSLPSGKYSTQVTLTAVAN